MGMPGASTLDVGVAPFDMIGGIGLGAVPGKLGKGPEAL